MSQKVEKPVLSGQRIKTRKRDEKEKYDPSGFRDALVSGLERAGPDLDAAYKYLDAAGSKLDYRRYGEVIFDVLIAGGLLLPGGSVSMDGESPKTNTCVFDASEDMDTMRNFEQVFVKLMRRYKYLEKMFEEEMKKVLVYLKGFDQQQRIKLARMTALWIGNGCVPPSVLLVLVNEHLVKENMALEFVLEVCVTLKQERGVTSLVTALKKGQLEGKLLEFLPINRRSEEALAGAFAERGLGELLKLHRAQASQEAKRELTTALEDDLNDEKPIREMIGDLREMAQRNNIPEHEVVTIIWQSVMSRGEWNKKEELIAEQAAKHLRPYTPLLAAFATCARSELQLLLKVQEYCYENMSFMRAFQKLVLMLYKSDVLSEEVILRWYREPSSTKGKLMFLEQMKKFIEWLQSAEEDEKEKYDPNGFCDALVSGLERAGPDLDAAYKYLDAAGSKLDYRRYGEVIFDVLIAGGRLLPGGSLSMDGESPKTSTCVFAVSKDMDTMRNFEQVFVKLIRRYKYLEKMFEEEMKKVLVYLEGFDQQQRIKLARMTALWIGNGCVPPSVLLVLVNEHLVKENMALEFVLEVCVTLKQERGVTSLVTALKKGQLEGKLMELLPINRRSEGALAGAFGERGLSELLKHRAQANQEAKRELTTALEDDLNDEKPIREMIGDLREMAQRNNIPEHEVVTIIWQSVMSRGEWNKKEELIAKQAAKYLRPYTLLLAAFSTCARSELQLLLKVQEYCYENKSFMGAFQKLVLMLYKTEVLSEEVILRWYQEPSSTKGKLMFLEQMKKFIEWLQSAEEESESGEEED